MSENTLNHIRFESKDQTKSLDYYKDKDYFVLSMTNLKYNQGIQEQRIHKDYIKILADLFRDLLEEHNKNM